MSKSKTSGPPSAKEIYKYPSHYGSHASMLIEDKEVAEDAIAKMTAAQKARIENPVALQDEFGIYVTDRNRLDSGGADPNRYEEARLSNLFAGTQKKE